MHLRKPLWPRGFARCCMAGNLGQLQRISAVTSGNLGLISPGPVHFDHYAACCLPAVERAYDAPHSDYRPLVGAGEECEVGHHHHVTPCVERVWNRMGMHTFWNCGSAGVGWGNQRLPHTSTRLYGFMFVTLYSIHRSIQEKFGTISMLGLLMTRETSCRNIYRF